MTHASTLRARFHSNEILLDAVKSALVNMRYTKDSYKHRAQLLELTDSSPPQVVEQKVHPVRYLTPSQKFFSHENRKDKIARIKCELLDAGVTAYGMLKSESRTLPRILHDNEHIEAVVYGMHRDSSVMLVATHERIIFIDKKIMLTHLDEVSYEVVSGVGFQMNLLTAKVILHTPVANYDIKYANMRCAENFVRHIEEQRLARELAKEDAELSTQAPPVIERPKAKYDYPNELKEKLVGYYMMPTEDEEPEKALA